MSELYGRIESLCKGKGVSVTQMCRESGANRASLSDLKMGRKRRLSAETLSLIGRYFDVPIDFLIGTTDIYGFTDEDWALMGQLFANERTMRGRRVEDCADGSVVTADELRLFEGGQAALTPMQLVVACGKLGLTPEYVFHGFADRLYKDTERKQPRLNSPSIADDTVTFPVIGGVAAGYDHIAYEDWTGDSIEIPRSYLHGRDPTDYFVLQVKGDSMYPDYQDGDHVLVRRQKTMDRSGQVGVVVYNDEESTLKRIEYVMGENWMTLRPINPQYPPITIRDEALEHCTVLGVAKMVIRELSQ